MKKRIDQHLNETRDLVNLEKHSDSFAKHFATHFAEERKFGRRIGIQDVRAIVRTEILWEGNPISCLKTFGKYSCRLCMQERVEIYKALRNSASEKLKIPNLINSAHEMYGACRHKAKFHRFVPVTYPSTDDGG